jgi:alpha-1,2-mannosyltransferase
VVLTIWLTPHAMIYDWALLLIPAVLLWEHQPEARHQWTVVFAAIWLATFVSAPLTVLQLQLAQRAAQVTVPILVAATVCAVAQLRGQRMLSAVATPPDRRWWG